MDYKNEQALATIKTGLVRKHCRFEIVKMIQRDCAVTKHEAVELFVLYANTATAVQRLFGQSQGTLA